MRFFARFADDIEEWVAGNPTDFDPDYKTWLISNMLAISAPGFKELFENQIAALKNRKTLRAAEHGSMLLDLRQVLPWAAAPSSFEADITIGLTDSTAYFLDEDLSKNAVVRDALTQRQPHAPAGSKRGDVYRKVFGKLVPLATKIEILDPYAGAAIADSDKQKALERTWLLRKFMQDAPGCTIKIWTEVQPARPNEYSRDEERAWVLVDSARSLLEANNRFQGRLFLAIRQPHTLFHERMVRLFFEKGAISFRLDRGLDTFRNDKFISAEDFDNRPNGRFTGYLGQIRSGTHAVIPELEVTRI